MNITKKELISKIENFIKDLSNVDYNKVSKKDLGKLVLQCDALYALLDRLYLGGYND